MDEEISKLFSNNTNETNAENIFYVDKRTSINNIIENINRIIEDSLYSIDNPFIIKLLPGEYNESFILPPYVYLEGYDKDLVFINLNNKKDNIQLTSNTCISNVTINYYNNYNDYDKLNLINIDSKNYNDSYMFKKNELIVFKNIDFNLYDIYINNIFGISEGFVTFDKCNININNFTTIKYIENYNIINLDAGTKLNIYDSNINIKINSIYYTLINSNLSNINISNTNIKYSINNLEDIKSNYIFNDLFSNIEINNCKIMNSSLGGEIFNLNEDLFMEHYIDYDSIIVNDKYLEINNYKSKSLIKHLKGIYFNNNKYVFFDKIFHEEDNKVIISYNKYVNTKVENKLLFRFNINNCYIYNSNLDHNNTYSQNYIINIINTYIEDSNFKGIVNYNLNEQGYLGGSSISNIDGIKTNNIYSDKYSGDGGSLGNIGLRKINNGYSIIKRYNYNLGEKSINLGYNTKSKISSGNYSLLTGKDNMASGDYSNSNGLNNISEGDFATTFGEGNISRYNHSFSLGKYNNYLGDFLFTIGNGENDNERNNALQVHNNGTLQVDKKIEASIITDGNINIEDGNISGVKNIEIEDNIYCDGDLYLEGEIKGRNLKNSNYLTNTIEFYLTESNNIIISTLKIDLNGLLIPNNLGGIIGPKDYKNGCLAFINEKTNGMIYKIKIFCIETPDFPELRFIASNYKELKKGALIENWHDFNKNKNINLFYSYDWKKGKTKKNKEFEFNDLDSDFNIYIARMPKQKKQTSKEHTNISKGKFLLNIYGIKMF